MIICKKRLQKHIEAKGPQARLTRNEFILTNEQSLKNETFPIKNEDMEKLRPDTDLNDTIVGNYIKMFNFVFLPQHL
jgi:Ulp1 family protease